MLVAGDDDVAVGPNSIRSDEKCIFTIIYEHWSDYAYDKGSEGKFRHAPYVSDVGVLDFPVASTVTEFTFECLASRYGGSSSYSYP